MISLIVGLGNPGSEYALHRHNVGFMMIDALAHAHGRLDFQRKGQSLIMPLTINDHKMVLMKPLTFMNRSGIAVADYASFFKILPSSILVMHDDMGLPFLKVRTKQAGGHGGHNGLKSLDSSIGNDYWRLRVGIDHPGDVNAVTSHVLGNFSLVERQSLVPFLKDFVEYITYFLEGAPDTFQNKMALAFKVYGSSRE